MIRFILIGFLIYLVLRSISRVFFPWLYISNRSRGYFNNTEPVKNRRREGEVSIEDARRRGNNKIIHKDEGEYIDYEEVKD